MIFSLETMSEVIKSKEMRVGVEKYLNVMQLYRSSENLYNAPSFKTKYIGFYRMLKKSQLWYDTYFGYMNNLKENKEITFDEIFDFLYDKFGKNEASFSSKLLHTINNDMPILDQNVLINLGLFKKYMTNKYNKKEIYKEIQIKYAELLQDSKINMALEIFDNEFEDVKDQISRTKKLDFILWKL